MRIIKRAICVFCVVVGMLPQGVAFADVVSAGYLTERLALKLNTSELAQKIADAIVGKEDKLNKVSSLNTTFSDNTKYPSALAVKNALTTKVDVASGTNQTLQGTYNVSGVMYVNTPTLPAAN